MHGENIFARTVSQNALKDKFGNTWQYHSRSDAHSKAACWGIMFDLLQHCNLLASHVTENKIGYGINHEMHDFRVNRKKNLDLVVCTPSGQGFTKSNFVDYGKRCKVSLTGEELEILKGMPLIRQCPVGTVKIAIEAKACMTEHLKARPRLYDELSSSYQTILGDTNQAIAASFVTINVSKEFISTDRNKHDLSVSPAIITEHSQPRVAKRVLEKIKELRRRSSPDEEGYDAIGVVLVECRNDGSEVKVHAKFEDGEDVDRILTYESMIERISHLYATRFKAL